VTASDLFAATAEYYARYRPSYPEDLLREVLARTGGGGEALADLGCGTGELALSLSRHFRDVLALDVDPDMVAAGRAKAAALGIGDVTWHVGRAEDVDLGEERWDLITAGASFHWMDRELLAPRCHRALRPGRAMAILGTNSAPWQATEPWHEAVVAVIRRWLGDRRRAGSAVYGVDKIHEDFLGPAGFRIETFEHAVVQSWDPESYLGFLYSTSFAGIHVLGDAKEDFERDMRRTLLEHAREGRLEEVLEFYVVIGHKD
jgi:ubiquinone/menaquinone biosynthesis C-methylase UbiE